MVNPVSSTAEQQRAEKSLPVLLCSFDIGVLGSWGGTVLGFWEPPSPFWGGFGAIYLGMGWHGRESQVYGRCELGILKPLLLGLLLEI